MNRFLRLTLLLTVFFIAANVKQVYATHAAGGEIAYEWVSDSTYRVYFKFYRLCGNSATGGTAGAGNSVLLCYHNTCNSQSGSKTLTKMTVLPDSSTNGAPVSDGCPGVGTTCNSSTSTIPGYEEYWYSGTVTLPSRCTTWVFSVQVSNRNPSSNLVNANSRSFYAEATLNNLNAQGNSSPFFSNKPVPTVCVNQNYTYNNGGVDPNSDSLTFEMVRPLYASGCPPTTAQVPFSSASPSYNLATNPIQTGNSFTLDTTNGQMTFKPTLVGPATMAIRINEYRNGIKIGSVVRDIQVQVINCSVPAPIVNTVSSTITGATYTNGRVEACASVAMSFCFDLTSNDTAAKLHATDNHNASAPGSSVSYTGQGTDSIRGCFSWTPSTLDTGLRVFTVSAADTSCKSPGVVVTQTFVLPIYIWPVTDIIKDTTICYGDTTNLKAVGGSNFTWTVLSGGSPITSLSCTTCKEPLAWPTLTTQYVVTNSANQYCSKNKDTATVTVLDIRNDTLQGSTNAPLCAGDTLKLFSTAASSGYGYRWTGPNGFSSTLQNPVIANAQVSATGNYILKSSKQNCLSNPDTVAVVVSYTPDTPVVSHNTPVCAGTPVYLTAIVDTGVTYQWTGPGGYTSTLQNPVITNTDTTKSGNYILTLSKNGCLSEPDTAAVVIKYTPVIDTYSVMNTTNCSDSNGSITLSGLVGSKTYTVNYKKNGVSQSTKYLTSDASGNITIDSLSAATYSSIYIALDSCVSDSVGPIIVSDPNAPVLTSGSNSPVCENDTLNLFSSADSTGVVWSWTGPNGFTSTDQNPQLTNTPLAAGGTYYVNAVKNNCASDTDSVLVTVVPLPATPVAGSNSPVCTGDTLFLTATTVTGATYNWEGPQSFSDTQQNPSRVITTSLMSGVYSVTATANGCTSSEDTVNVTVYVTPSAPVASSNSPVCEGDTLQLSASTIAGVTYSWEGPGSYASTDQNPSIVNAQPAQSGDYIVKTLENGCYSEPDTVNVAVHPTPATPVASSNSPLCTGNILYLSASGPAGATYSWTGPSSFSSSSQSPNITNIDTTNAGVYSVIAYVNNCPSAEDTVHVSVNPTPAPIIDSIDAVDPSKCLGSDGKIVLKGLSASTTYTVNYSYNSVTQSPLNLVSDGSGVVTITGLAAGDYDNITVTAPNGCTSLPSSLLTLADPKAPVITLNGSGHPTTCSGTEGFISLTGLTAGKTYIANFLKNGVSQSPVSIIADTSGMVKISSLAAGNYTVITLTLDSCQSNQVGPVRLDDPNAPVVVATNNTPVCEDSTFQLFAAVDSTGVIWSWTGPNSYTSTQQNPVITNPLPTYSGIYVVTASKNNCTSEPDSTTVLVKPTPATPVAGNNSPLCDGSTLNLTSSTISGASYFWEGPKSFSDTVQNPVIANADTSRGGDYSVYVVVDGCPSLIDTTEVIIHHIPVIGGVSYTHPTTCGGTQGSITLTGLVSDTTYTINYLKNGISQSPVGILSDNSGKVLISGLGAGTYSQLSVSLNSCMSDTLAPIVLEGPVAPVVVATNNTPVCEDSTFQLFAAVDSTGVIWSWTGPNGYTSTQQNPVITNPLPTYSGVYIVTASKNNCTSEPDSTSVLVKPTPATPLAGNNSPLCDGSTLNLTSSTISGASYFWEGPKSFSDTVQNPVIANADTSRGGDYSVYVVVDGCPSLIDTTEVIIHHIPVIGGVSYTHPTTCGGTQGSITLTGLVSDTTYTINYLKNGISQSPVGILSDNSGKVLISGLGAGTFSQLSVSLNSCMSDTLAPIVLEGPVAPVVVATNNTPVCEDSTFQLFAAVDSTGVIWNWTGPNGYTSIQQNPVITNPLPTYSGVYVVTANKNNCTSEPDSTTVLVKPTPATPVAGNNSPLCDGSTLNLTSSTISGASYFWEGPKSFSDTVQNPVIVNADTSRNGDYTVYVVIDGCPSLIDTTEVIIHHIPVIGGVSYTHPTTCGGTQGSITLTGLVSDTTYTINYLKNGIAQSPVGILSDNNGNVLISGLGAGAYSQLSVSLNSCMSDTLAAIVLDDPNAPVVVATNNTPVCEDSTFQLFAAVDSTGVIWSWTGPNGYTSTQQNPVITNPLPTYSGVYIVTATKNNCTSEPDSTSVLVIPTPATPVPSSNSPICSDNTLFLFTPSLAGGSWSWTGPKSFTSTQQNPQIAFADTSHSGTYIVTVTKDGCISLPDSTVVVVNPLPAPVIDSIDYTHPTTCGGNDGTITLKGLIPNTQYTVNYLLSGVAQSPLVQSTNSSGNMLLVGLVQGLYADMVLTSPNGCYSDTLPDIQLSDPVLPTISVDSLYNPTTCGGNDGQIVLKGLDANGTYDLYYKDNGKLKSVSSVITNNQGKIYITGLAAGVYEEIYFIKYNCSTNVIIRAELVDPLPPFVSASNNTPGCEDSTFQLFGLADSSGVTWNWTGPAGFNSTLQNPIVTNALPAQSGIYTLTATKNNCTSVGDTTYVIVHPTPVTPVATSNSPVCSGDTLFLYASNVSGATYTWSGPNSFVTTDQNPVRANADTFMKGDYIVYVTENNCPSEKDTITVLINQTPDIDSFTYTNPITCGGTQGGIKLYGLLPNTAYGVTYFKNATPQSVSLNTDANGIINISSLDAAVYSKIALTINGCTSDTLVPVTLTGPIPPVLTTATSITLCQGDTLRLTSRADSSSVTWNWTGPAGFTSSLQSPVVNSVLPSQSGNYIVTATKNNCVSEPDTVDVLIHPTPPTPVPSSNSPICDGDVLNLYATTFANAVYGWSGPNGFTSKMQNPSINRAGLNAAGVYSVFIEVNGCNSLPASTTVTIHPIPVINNQLYTDPTTCGGSQGTITLTGLIPNVAYNINYRKNGTPLSTLLNTNNTGDVTITGLTAGVYSQISVGRNNCFSDTTVPITLVDPNAPVVTATGSAFVCERDNIQLFGAADSSGVNWSWTGPAAFTSFLQNPVRNSAIPAYSGSYILTAEKNNCVSEPDTFEVYVKPAPIVTPGNNGTFCPGDTIKLFVNNIPTATYDWWGPNSYSDTGRTPFIVNAQPGLSGAYYVRATDSGCTSLPDSTIVTVHPTPVSPTVQLWYTFCQFETSTALSATGQNLLWYTTATGGTGTPVAPVPSTTTVGVITFYVSQTVNGCESPRTPVNVRIYPKPQPPVATPDSQQYCLDAPTQALSASGINLKWYTWPTGGAGVINPPVPSSATLGYFNWYVSQTSADGCESDRDTVTVRIVDNIIANLIADKDSLCEYDSVIIRDNNTGVPGSSYLWSFDNATVLSGDSSGPYVLSWEEQGLKQIRLSYSGIDCGISDSITVFVKPIPDAEFTMAEHLCKDEVTMISPVSNDIVSYVWELDGAIVSDSVGSTRALSWDVEGDKEVTLTITSANGCTSLPYSRTVSIHELPDAEILSLGSERICFGDTVMLEAREGFDQIYNWRGKPEYLTNDSIKVKAIINGETNIVTLNVHNSWNCYSFDTAVVKAEPCCTVFLPSAFTPNNDGLNDIFTIITDGNQEIMNFVIMNRWGQKIFQSSNQYEGWDGTFNGKRADVGSYTYYIKYRCKSDEIYEKKGDVTLLR